MDNEKRTLEKRETKEDLSSFFSGMAVGAVLVVTAVLFGHFLPLPSADVGKGDGSLPGYGIHDVAKYADAEEITAEETSSLTREATAKSTETVKPSPLGSEPGEPNDLLGPYLDQIYVYNSLGEVPNLLPEDVIQIKFPVGRDCARGNAGTVLKTFTHDSLGQKIEIAVPDLGEISEKTEEHGYQIITVFATNLETGAVGATYFGFNPEEKPWITLRFHKDQTIRAAMDAQVFAITLTSDPGPIDGLYQSSSAGESNYNYYGGGSGGNDDYLFNKFSIAPKLPLDNWCYPLEWAAKDIEDYAAYWQENRDFILNRKSYFSADRTVFDLVTYTLREPGVSLKSVTKQTISLTRRGGDELVIMRVENEEKGDYARITLNGDDIWYSIGYTSRLTGVTSDRILLPNGISLTEEQVEIVLKFIENPEVQFF